MKKQALWMALIVLVLTGRAQLPNTGFENLNASGKIKNWGRFLLFQVSIDSNGVSQGDSVVYDHDLYFSTPDAHSGTKALEMRNAYFYGTGEKIVGSVKVSQNDTDYAAFSEMIPIPQTPDNFTFYYKFFPMGGDTAMARLDLYDSTGTQVGEARAELTGTTSAWSQFVKPITYFNTGTAPAFVAVYLSAAKTSMQATFGSRFLVDDVALTNTVIATGLLHTSSTVKNIMCFPNPATDQLTIALPGSYKSGKLMVTDLSGKLIREESLTGEKSKTLDVKDLAKGIYTIRMTSNETTYTTKFIK